MIVQIPDDLWSELCDAEAANNAVVKRKQDMFSGGNGLTVEAATTSLRLLKAQIAVATAAKESKVSIDAVLDEFRSWARVDPYSEKARTLDQVVEYMDGLR